VRYLVNNGKKWLLKRYGTEDALYVSETLLQRVDAWASRNGLALTSPLVRGMLRDLRRCPDVPQHGLDN
jgi:hypothetical protein